LLALAILVGGLVLELFVLPRDLAPLESARRRLRRWITVAVAILIVTSAGDLIARARVMSGGDLSQAMAALPLVLTRTHFGAIWISRATMLALLLAVSLSRALPARGAGLVLSLGIVLTGSLTGHAADWGDLSLAVIVDWLHAVAATAWTGGLFGLPLMLRRPDRKSTRLNSSHVSISYAVFCLKKKKKNYILQNAKRLIYVRHRRNFKFTFSYFS